MGKYSQPSIQVASLGKFDWLKLQVKDQDASIKGLMGQVNIPPTTREEILQERKSRGTSEDYKENDPDRCQLQTG